MLLHLLTLGVGSWTQLQMVSASGTLAALKRMRRFCEVHRLFDTRKQDTVTGSKTGEWHGITMGYALGHC